MKVGKFNRAGHTFIGPPVCSDQTTPHEGKEALRVLQGRRDTTCPPMKRILTLSPIDRNFGVLQRKYRSFVQIRNNHMT
jgi:hypothetical protein